jgi:LCP family protein required for cell wall assembly
MSEWPEGWFRDGSGAAAPSDRPGQADTPTARVPADRGARGGGPAYPAGAVHSDLPTVAGNAAAGPNRPGPAGGSAWPAQPPASPSGGTSGPGAGGAAAGAAGAGGRGSRGSLGAGGRRIFRPRRIVAIIAAVIALILVAAVGMYFYFNGQLVRKNVLVNYYGRPAVSAGQNWLITGSDSRQGLTAAQERQLATGSLSAISGERSDTILILHMPAGGGRPVLVSIPRDSYVPVPGHGYSKINAAFDFGGPRLLAETVQDVTGLHISHYMGIGFGGLVNVVNSVGGVDMCLPGPMVDPKAGLNLKAGCQTLNGDQALGFVRTRNFAESDLQREQDQRLFLKALLSKMTSLGTILDPFAIIPAASGSAGALTVDQSASLYDLIQVAFALRNPETTTVPIANTDYITPAGDSVQWNQTEALQLFNALKNDTPVPPSLLTGSKVAPTV